MRFKEKGDLLTAVLIPVHSYLLAALATITVRLSTSIVI